MEQNNSKDLIFEFENMNLNEITFNGNDLNSKTNQKDFSFNLCDNQNDNLKEFTLNDYAEELDLKDLGKNIPSSQSVVILNLEEDLTSKKMLKKRTFAEKDKENEKEEGIVKKLKKDDLLVKKF